MSDYSYNGITFTTTSIDSPQPTYYYYTTPSYNWIATSVTGKIDTKWALDFINPYRKKELNKNIEVL